MKTEQKCGFCNTAITRRPTKTGMFFCTTNCKAIWQVLQREKLGYTKEWLTTQYFDLKKDCVKIAKEINRDPKSVWNWFKYYGINIRKRGADSSPGTFKNGHKKGVGRIHTVDTKEKIRAARIADGHVPYLKNGVHWLKIPGAISPNYKGGITPDRQSVYSSIQWVESVKAVWARDNATCQRCGKHHNTTENRGTFHIHHIVSFMVKEKRTEVDNLILMCNLCHKWIHSKKNTNKLWLKTS